MAHWTRLFGENLLTKTGSIMSTTDLLVKKKVIGVYFSAQWCPPCRAFTPVLAETYEKMIAVHPEFEIIFVSSDREQDGFDEYYNKMPWIALPYSNRSLKENLAKQFGLKTIPHLVFLDQNGETINPDGRNLVARSNGNIEEVWNVLA